MDNRIRVNKWVIKNIRDELLTEIQTEYKGEITDAIMINIALLKYIALRDNQTIDIKILENGKIIFKFT